MPFIALAVLAAAALVGAASFLLRADQLSEFGAGFADVALVMEFFAWVYIGVAAGAAIGGALLAGRVRFAAPLVRAGLAVSALFSALILWVVGSDSMEILDGGVRIVGDASMAMAAWQLTASVVTFGATVAALVLVGRRRASPRMLGEKAPDGRGGVERGRRRVGTE
jgi:hypothetical protein